MLIFNHDLDCHCIGDNKPRCALRSACMLKQVETNFKDVKHGHIRAEVEIIKKSLQEGITRPSLDQSVFIDTSAGGNPEKEPS